MTCSYTSIFAFSEGNMRFHMPNLVMKTIMMIEKVYGAEISVFMAPLRGATSGLSLSTVFTLFLPFLSISAFYLHSTTMIVASNRARNTDIVFLNQLFALKMPRASNLFIFPIFRMKKVKFLLSLCC